MNNIDMTVGYYQAFFPDLMDDMETLMRDVKRRLIPDVYGLFLNTVVIRAPTETESKFKVVIDVSITFMFTGSYEYEDYTFTYGVDNYMVQTIRKIDSYENRTINYYHYLFTVPCGNWLRRIHFLSDYYAKQKFRTIEKELIAAAWHPKRVAKWLEAGIAIEDM